MYCLHHGMSYSVIDGLVDNLSYASYLHNCSYNFSYFVLLCFTCKSRILWRSGTLCSRVGSLFFAHDQKWQRFFFRSEICWNGGRQPDLQIKTKTYFSVSVPRPCRYHKSASLRCDVLCVYTRENIITLLWVLLPTGWLPTFSASIARRLNFCYLVCSLS